MNATLKNPPLLLVLLAAAGCAEPPRRATFDVRHELRVQVPQGARELRVWLAVPQADKLQTISDSKIETPLAHRLGQDSEGNQVLFLEGSPPAGEALIVHTFKVERLEQRNRPSPSAVQPLGESDRVTLKSYLEPDTHVVIDDKIQALAREIVGGETHPLLASRRIYDWVLENIDYWVKEPKSKKASPVGSSEYCLASRTGNCTDFHSLYAALSRAAGIPTRLVYGSFLKKELDGQDVDQSYHCWIEFYAPGAGWVPLDVAVADIYAGDFKTDTDNESLVRRTTADGYRGPEPQMVDYYFGNLEERRVAFSTGRDLRFQPPAKSEPVNALPKAHVEIDGAAVAEKQGWTRKLTYRELKGS